MENKILKPPSWLDVLAKAYWRRFAPVLLKNLILTESNKDLVASVCQHYSTYRTALETLRKEGRTMLGIGGILKQHPLCMIEKEAWNCYVRGFRELGINAKACLPAEDELDSFLKQSN